MLGKRAVEFESIVIHRIPENSETNWIDVTLMHFVSIPRNDDILRFENIAMWKHFALNYAKEPIFLDYSAKGKAVKNWHSKAMLIDFRKTKLTIIRLDELENVS